MGLEQQDLKPLKKNIFCLCNIKTAKIATAVKAWAYCQKGKSSGQWTNSDQNWDCLKNGELLYAYSWQCAPLNLPLVRQGCWRWHYFTRERHCWCVRAWQQSQTSREAGETSEGDARVTGNMNRQLNQSGWPRLLLCTDGCPGPSEETNQAAIEASK